MEPKDIALFVLGLFMVASGIVVTIAWIIVIPNYLKMHEGVFIALVHLGFLSLWIFLGIWLIYEETNENDD